MDIEMKIFWGIWIFVEILLIIERSGKSSLSFYLAGVVVQLIVWRIFGSSFGPEFFKEGGWIIIFIQGAILWFIIPWLKREAVRGDGGGFTVVEEEM